MSQGYRVLQHSLNHCMGVLMKYQCSDIAWGEVLVIPKTRKKSQKNAKPHPECIKIGEIASQGRRRLMDDENILNFI